MKNRKIKTTLALMMVGSLIFCNSAYICAEADTMTETQETETQEAEADTAQINIDPVMGCWGVDSNTDVDLFGADGKVYEKTSGGVYEEFGEYSYVDGVLNVSMKADGGDVITLEGKLVPYDVSKLNAEYTEDDFYLEQMLELTIFLPDDDPMNESTETQTMYGMKYRNQKDFVMKTLGGYTWTTDSGDLQVGEDGSLTLTTLTDTTTGKLSTEDGEVFNFTWDGKDPIPYIYAGVTESGVTFVKAADTTKTIVLSNGRKTE